MPILSDNFENILDSLLQIDEKAPWVDQVLGQLQLLKMDLRFLLMFSICLERVVYASDEESREILSMFTSLEEIWPEECLDLYCTEETWTMERFHSVNFELQGKIQQSKQQVVDVVWCGNLMRSSPRRWHYEGDIEGCLENLVMNLKDFSRYRADKNVAMKKQIDILKDKILFLDKCSRFLDKTSYTEENSPFLEFVADYANNATCLLACFYWAKEDDDEDVTTETSSLLFDMLHKFMPLAYDVTPSYLGIRKSHSLWYPGPSLPGDVVESWVDFLFGHQDYVLKDDFLLLRDGLIFLFTFLMYPPCENAEEEDLMRGQIYALFHDDDAYLLLPFNEMKEDFSHKQGILLRDCMIRVDRAVAKIGQLYHGNISDSWIILEVDKMINIYFSSIQRELTWIQKHARWADLVPGGQLQLYILELRFLKMLLLCFVTWDDNDVGRSIITCLQGIWRNGEEEKGFLAHRLHAIRRRTRDITDWHPLSSELQEKIQLSKLEIEARSVNLFSVSSFQCTAPSTSRKISKFMDSILDNLDDLVTRFD